MTNAPASVPVAYDAWPLYVLGAQGQRTTLPGGATGDDPPGESDEVPEPGPIGVIP